MVGELYKPLAVAFTLVINLFMISIVGYYTNGTTTLKVKFSVVLVELGA